jgi:collagenase-like PrtC family protease
MRLALAPIPYFWDRDAVYKFYTEIERMPLDIVYLGETVCSKRRALRLSDWLNIADRLAAAGKEAVLSTLALIEAESELATLQRIAENGRFPVEANDMAAVNLLAGRAPFVAGPHLNVYNADALAFLAELGARRWVPPVELDRHSIAALQTQRPPRLETEVLGFGRMPLGFSARCFTAHARKLPKDECDFCCRDDIDGLLLSTRERQPFLLLNGIQIQSAATCSLLSFVDDLASLGINTLRLSPQHSGLSEIVGCFRAVCDGALDTRAAVQRVARHAPIGVCDGYWNGLPGMNWSGNA